MTAPGTPRPTPDRAEARAVRLAAAIERRGLLAPAVLLLDAHRPLAPLLGAAAAFLRPLAALAAGGAAADALELLGHPRGADALLAALERTAEAPDRPCRTSAS